MIRIKDKPGTKTGNRSRDGDNDSGGGDVRHLAIRVNGTVQGVGFRPFVYNLARRCELSGSVMNDNGGVLIHAQGEDCRLNDFLDLIRTTPPPAAYVDSMLVSPLPVVDYADFRILPSTRSLAAITGIPPDIAICPECLRELRDPPDRRFAYPFINCTNCGPRFTITEGLPYDRHRTTMSPFVMCEDCRTEYENPSDRRFHAQPVACPNCGPKLTFLLSDTDGWSSMGDDAAAILRAVRTLRERKIVMVQGIGGFHLACDCRDDDTVRELRRRKRRYEKPFALMFPTLDIVRGWCEVSDEEEQLLTSPRAPIVLLKKRTGCPATGSIAPDNPYIGVLMPYAPVHVIIMERIGFPLVMTSANFEGEPIAYRTDDALERVRSIADAALVHNRDIRIFADDSVVRVMSRSPRMLRRARGYVPVPIHVPGGFQRDVLAFGSQLKNTLCLGKGNSAILSQHIGDMDSESSWDAHRCAMDHLLRLFDAHVELAACDLHPDYSTTRIAEEWSRSNGVPLVRVQHHHAHLASCLAENGEADAAIGLCLDGTGYGTDGTLWGGELLVGDMVNFERAGHLLAVPMPGGESAVRFPWRMALAWLRRVFGEHIFDLPLPLLSQLRKEPGDKAVELLVNPHLPGNHAPLTSGLGRLFDAVAAILFFGTRSQYEGQAAAQLEWMMSNRHENPYPVEIEETGDGLALSPIPLFRQLCDDIAHEVQPAIISRRFHEGIVHGFARMCTMTRERYGVNRVALTGGCFQNEFLLSGLVDRLTADGFRVLTHHRVPTNDGGVSLGQAVAANSRRN